MLYDVNKYTKTQLDIVLMGLSDDPDFADVSDLDPTKRDAFTMSEISMTRAEAANQNTNVYVYPAFA